MSRSVDPSDQLVAAQSELLAALVADCDCGDDRRKRFDLRPRIFDARRAVAEAEAACEARLW